MEEYLKEIIDRYFPNEYINKKINIIVPKIVQYYGEEYVRVIIDALRTLEIYLCPPELELNTFINSNINMQIENYYNNYLNNSVINNSSGITYSVTPEVIYNKDNKEFVNKGLNRKKIFIKKPSMLNCKTKEEYKVLEEQIMKTLINQIVQQIKSVTKNNEIRNGRRIIRNGLHQSFSNINFNGQNVVINFISESGIGLNKAINEYDTINIFTDIYGYEPKTNAYPLEVEVLKRILKNDDILSAIHKNEIDGDIVELRNFFANKFYEGSYDYLIELFDEIMNSSYKVSEIDYNRLKEEALAFIESLKKDGSVLKKEVA